MSRRRYRRVTELFREACDLTPEDRESFLDEACEDDADLRRDVESLLASDAEPATAIESAAKGAAARALARGVSTDEEPVFPPPADDLPVEIAGYAIVRRIGAGGMGVVFEARQDHPARTVAIKVVRSEMVTPELVRRFRREAEVLGRLHHPGIAHIYDAGIAERTDANGVVTRQPFFVMERIEGEPLDAFVRSRAYDTQEILDLMARVCDAVHHAHSKGVIHRDLKPANILVDSGGSPKILDFGVARVAEGDVDLSTLETDPGRIVGTLSYMSPEQVESDASDLDTRSDVYALGLILYELLAGRRAYDVGKRPMLEALRVVREEEPTRLGTISTRFRGDIETIVGKSIEKERARRYESAAAFASDLRRFLRDEPISARPPSALYQLRKFSARNRALVAGVIGVFLTVSVGFAVSTVLYLAAEDAREGESRQKDRAILARQSAEGKAAEASAVSAFLIDALTQANAIENPDGRRMSVWELLDEAAVKLEGSFAEQPEVEATVRLTIGEAYRVQGRADEALRHLRRALDLRRALPDADLPGVAEAELALASARYDRRELDEARQLIESALVALHATRGSNHPDTLDAERRRARALNAQSEYAEAEAVLERVVETRRSLAGDHRAELASDLGILGGALFQRQSFEPAMAAFREAIELSREARGENHPDVGRYLNNLAVVLRTVDRLEEAESRYSEAIDVFRNVYGDEHPDVAVATMNIARLREMRGDVAGAEELMRAALEMQRRLHDAGHPDVAGAMHNLGMLLKRRQRFEEARSLVAEALRLREERLGENTVVADSLMGLGGIEWNAGNLDEAERLIGRAAGLRRRLHGPGYIVAQTLAELGGVLAAKEDLAAAEDALREAYEMYEAAPGPDDMTRVTAAYHFAAVLMRRGKHDEAETFALEVHERTLALLGEGHPTLSAPRDLLARIYEGLGRPRAAEAWRRE